MNKKRKICVVTGSRAEYGLLRWIIDGIQNSSFLELQLVVTGMHLSPEFGLTFQKIKDDGFKINKKVKMYDGDYDSPLGMTLATAKCTAGIADALDSLKPDVVLLTVDRVSTI